MPDVNTSVGYLKTGCHQGKCGRQWFRMERLTFHTRFQLTFGCLVMVNDMKDCPFLCVFFFLFFFKPTSH